MVVVVDDLQWADVASLELFGHLADRLPDRVLLLGALRDRGLLPSPELVRTLAGVSRIPGHHRVRPGPLGLPEVTELVGRETGRTPGPIVARSVHARSGGNPFLVRELARTLEHSGLGAEDGPVPPGVPSTVRDIVRDRLAGLDARALELLQMAAFVGKEVELALFARLAGTDIATCLAELEPIEPLGLLEPSPDDPYVLRFAHDLVRESISETMPAWRSASLHLRLAEALESTDPNGEHVPELVAHHLWAAGPLSAPGRTATALLRAGRRATIKSAFEAAERLFRSEVQLARRAKLAELEVAGLAQLIALAGMREMYGIPAVELIERAEHLARQLGHDRDATVFLYSRWAAHTQSIELDRSGPLAWRLLKETARSLDPVVRAYGLAAWGIQRWSAGDVKGGIPYLRQAEETLCADLTGPEEGRAARDMRLLMVGMTGEIFAVSGDDEAAQRVLDALERLAGDDAYGVTVASTINARIAVLTGDTDLAARSAARGSAVDPDFFFVFLGTYQRLAQCWARCLTGQSAAEAVDEARRLIAANLEEPARSCVALWYGLLGEMLLTVGALDEAAEALDEADRYLHAHEQRYAEGLLRLLRARLLHSQRAPEATVRAMAEEARTVSARRGTHLFARQAAGFLAELGRTGGPDGHDPGAHEVHLRSRAPS